MGKSYGIKQAPYVNTFGSGAYDSWPASTGKNYIKISESAVLSNRLKRMKVSLAIVPIKDSERSDVPVAKLVHAPDQEWCLDEIEQELKINS